MPPAPPGQSRMDFLNMFDEDTLVDKDGAPKTPESEEATIPFVCILFSFLHIFIFWQQLESGATHSCHEEGAAEDEAA